MQSLNLIFNRSKCRGRACFWCCRVISRGYVALVVGCGAARLLDCCVALLSGCGVSLLPARPVDLRARGEDVVEYPGKVACPSGRRCSTRNAVWCHSHPGFKSQRYRHCRPAPLGPGGFVMPTWCVVLPCAVWPRWCSGRRVVCWRAGLLCVPVGGGLSACCLLPRQISGRRVACPPARESSALRASLGASPRSPARPRRCPRAPQPGPPVPPAPSTPEVLCR